MGLPSVDKTWQYRANQLQAALGAVLTTNQRILRRVKNTLKNDASEGSPFTTPWTVNHSCDSVAAGTPADGVDRWDSDTDLVWANAGSAHSWFVFNVPGLGASAQILWSCSNVSGTGTLFKVMFSPSAGFTGGTTTADPTATDQVSISPGTNEWGGPSTNVNMVFNVAMSSDGQCTRVWFYRNNVPTGLWIFDKPKNPVPGWTNPIMCGMAGLANGGDALTIANWFDTAGPRMAIRSPNGPTNAFCEMTSEGTNNGLIASLNTFPNDIDNTYPMLPIGIQNDATAGARGRHAHFFDLWLGLVSNNEADDYPGDASRQFNQVGVFIMKWNGSVPVIS